MYFDRRGGLDLTRYLINGFAHSPEGVEYALDNSEPRYLVRISTASEVFTIAWHGQRFT